MEDVRTFMMSSDLNVPTPAMLIPAFAVPYAAPMAIVSPSDIRTKVHENIIYKSATIAIRKGRHTAAATPPNPMNGARIISSQYT